MLIIQETVKAGSAERPSPREDVWVAEIVVVPVSLTPIVVTAVFAPHSRNATLLTGKGIPVQHASLQPVLEANVWFPEVTIAAAVFQLPDRLQPPRPHHRPRRGVEAVVGQPAQKQAIVLRD